MRRPSVNYPADAADTGHIMLVVEAPRERTATAPLIPGTRQWEVLVIDQSSTGHGPTDSRRQADKSFRGGLGQGVLRIYTRSNGTVATYSWSTLSVSPFYSQAERPLAMGRLQLPGPFGGR